jgi:aspartyl-tRNA(Asn)/glutamyl-tRNA(Gln) amidotransferase subunit B
MEEGAFRADTNVSVKKKNAEKLGTRCELKNINSFKFISDAIEYEIERQIELLEAGKQIVQETRLWDTKEHKTISMRSKEEAADYRYMPDPDLPTINLSSDYIESIKVTMPELPHQRFERLIKINGLTPYESEIIVNDLDLAAYYEEAYSLSKSKLLINWVLRDVMALLKENCTIKELKVSPKKLALLIGLIEAETINNRAAQEVFEAIALTGGEPEAIIKERGLEQIGNSDELKKIIEEIIAANPRQTADYKAGKEKLWGFFVGQAMAKTKGRGNPQLIEELLKKLL